MAQITYLSSLKEHGPWLLDSTQLRRVDEVIEKQWPRLEADMEKQVHDQAEARMQEQITFRSSFTKISEDDTKAIRQEAEQWARGRSKNERTLTMYFNDGSKLSVGSFDEAILHPHTFTAIATGFNLQLRCGEFHTTATLGEYGGDELELRVSPEGSDIASTFFHAMRGWVESSKPTRWQQFWSGFKVFGVFLPLFWVSIMLTLLGIVGKDLAKQGYRQQAAAMLDKGLSPNDQTKAIEILLALQAEHFANGQKLAIPGWFWGLALGGLGVAIVLIFPPKATVGIGKGEARLRRSRRWIRFVSITVPTYILASMILPYLIALFKNVLAH